MKKIGFVIVCMLSCTLAFAQGIQFDPLTLEQALAKAKVEKKLVFVDATASWCMPCSEMAREVFALEEVGEYCQEQFVCIKIDIDQPDGKVFKNAYGVKRIPMLCLLQPDGTVRHRLQGRRTRDEFMEWAQRGVAWESSWLYLTGLLKEGKAFNEQNQVDYYMVLKALKEFGQADTLRTTLLAPLSLEKRSGVVFWPMYKDEEYGSAYFDEVVEYKDVFGKNVGKERVDTYVWEKYKQGIQDILYQNVKSPEVKQSMDHIFQKLSGLDVKEGERDKINALHDNVLLWGKIVKAYLNEDVAGTVEGMEKLVTMGQWAECLWYPILFVGERGSKEDKEKIGALTSKIISEFTKSKQEEWDCLQKFKFLGFPTSCNHVFWENALNEVKESGKPLLLECVRGEDAYFQNRNWMWDDPQRAVYLDSVCVSVRIDLEAPEVAFLRDRFQVTEYPAYFLLNADGSIRCHWEGMIESEEGFKRAVEEGLGKGE